ncbi:PEP/pyruvate-binding domain-containing protein [Actinokineospora sp. NPDC004072]
MDQLIPAGDPRLVDARVVGHKFARQERLRRAGFPVPAFCCVSAAAFDAAVGDRLTDPPADEAELLAWAAEVAAGLGAPEPALADALVAAATEIADGGLLAVRACVVADERGVGEDGVSDAFAGLTDSFLYVRPEDVPEKVARCWASGLAPASIAYRARRGLSADTIRVAVGVQRMVAGTRSFVAFSHDPRTRAETAVVAAAHGIGEGVVQERADVDHFYRDTATGAIRSDVAVKERMLVQGPDGPVPAAVPAEAAALPVLADAEVAAVADLVARVTEHFGLPQDIEGAFTADGELFLVQARPIVFGEPDVEWSNHNVTESFPGVSGALTYSQARQFYRLAFGDVYRRMGVPPRRLAALADHLDRMVGLLDGRVYYRLDAWTALHGQIPGFALVRPWWEKSMGLPPGPVPGRAEWLRAAPTLPGLALRLLRLPGQVRAFLRWWDAEVAACGDLSDRSPRELIALYRGLWAQVGNRWGVTLVNTFFLLAATTATAALLRRWTDGDEQQLLGGLLVGGAENRSVLGVRSAIALAELVAADPRAADRVLTGPPDQVWAELVGGAHGPALAAAAAEHLRRYGDRALHDLKLEEPSPRQRPGMLVDLLAPLVRAGNTVADSRGRERAARAAAEQDLRQRCPSRPRRLAVRALAAALRWCVKTREDTRYCRSQLYGISRDILWRLGDHLAEQGRLDRRDDVFDLTVDEVLGAYDGTLVEADLRAVAARRRAERAAAAARPDPQPQLSTPANRPVAVVRRTGAAEEGELRGLPSSAGVVRAPARVVLDPAVPPETCRDHIIVAKETDPGWLFLMMSARGMVVERGTLLSHTAITGRLLGIPTVVSVPGATTRIPDGALIEVDGAAGTVRLLDG